MISSKRKAPAKAPATPPPTPNVRKGNGAAPGPAIDFGGATDNYSLRLPTLMIEKIKGEAAFAKVTPPTVVRAAVEMFFGWASQENRAEKLAEMALRVPTKPIVRILARKSVKLTGTEARLEDTEHPDSSYKRMGADRYVLICETHANIRYDPNREHALAEVVRPWRWCNDCVDLLLGATP